MGFFDWVGVVFRGGVLALFVGFLLYFAILIACRRWDLPVAARVGLTVLALMVVIIPEAWELSHYHRDFFRSLSEPAYSEEGLWLSIKAMLLIGPLGHLAGFFAASYYRL